MSDPVPNEYTDLYATLSTDLNTFSTTLAEVWDGSLFISIVSSELPSANANSGPDVISSMPAVMRQLQEFKALGLNGVKIQVAFPILYQPFFDYLATQPGYQNLKLADFVSFYQQVAAAVRSFGFTLIVEYSDLISSDPRGAWAGVMTPYYLSLSWDQYVAARAASAVLTIQTLAPDFMVLLQEPTGNQSLQTNLTNPAMGAASVTAILNSVSQLGPMTTAFGAGVANWQPGITDYVSALLAVPGLDFFDMHVYPLNSIATAAPFPLDFGANVLAMVSLAKAVGKPISMTECWLWKMRDSEWNVLTAAQTESREGFSFWQPLDQQFIKLMQDVSDYGQFLFASTSGPSYLFAYTTYDSSMDTLPPGTLFNMWSQAGAAAAQLGQFSDTGYYYHDLLVIDNAAPSIPTGLKGSSGQPTSVFLTWNPSVDDVGVAGYNIIRNGMLIATTSDTQFQDNGLAGSTTYSYSVSAFDASGNISEQCPFILVPTRDVVPPSVPRGLTATPVSCKQINLAWQPSTDDVAVGNYKVYRGPNSTNLSQVGNTGTNSKYSDRSVQPATRYVYGVQAVDTSGNASWMSAVAAATTFPFPVPPAGVTASVLNKMQVAVSWRPVANAGSYRAFRGTHPNLLVQIKTIPGTSTSCTDSTVVHGTTYYYGIETADSFGDVSVMSTVVSITP